MTEKPEQPGRPLTEAERHRLAREAAKLAAAPFGPPDPRRRKARWDKPQPAA